MQLDVVGGVGLDDGDHLRHADGGVGLGLGDEDRGLRVSLGVAAGFGLEDEVEWWSCLVPLVYDEEFRPLVLILV